MDDGIKEKLTGVSNRKVIMLFLNERDKLDREIADIFSYLSATNFVPLYVTSSIPASNIISFFNNSKIKEYHIIDTITNSLYNGSNEPLNNTIFIDSPADLTRLSMGIDNFLRSYNNVFMFIDSITAFLIYNSEEEVLRFVHYVSSVVREKNHKVIFIVLSNSGISQLFLDKLRSFIDYEIEV